MSKKNAAPTTKAAAAESRIVATVKNARGDWAILRTNGADQELATKALEKLADSLSKSAYADAVLTMNGIDGAQVFDVAHKDATNKAGKTFAARITVQIARAVERLAYAGKIAPLSFVVTTIPTCTVDGQKIVKGTRIFKMR